MRPLTHLLPGTLQAPERRLTESSSPDAMRSETGDGSRRQAPRTGVGQALRSVSAGRIRAMEKAAITLPAIVSASAAPAATAACPGVSPKCNGSAAALPAAGDGGRAQINLSGAALTPPRHTGACEQNGGDARGPPPTAGYVLRSTCRVQDARLGVAWRPGPGGAPMVLARSLVSPGGPGCTDCRCRSGGSRAGWAGTGPSRPAYSCLTSRSSRTRVPRKSEMRSEPSGR